MLAEFFVQTMFAKTIENPLCFLINLSQNSKVPFFASCSRVERKKSNLIKLIIHMSGFFIFKYIMLRCFSKPNTNIECVLRVINEIYVFLFHE